MKIPWINEAKLVSKHPQLFHYTELKTLKLILESGGLVATRYDSTNDASECRALRPLITDVMFERAVAEFPHLIKELGFEFVGSDEVLRELIGRDVQTCHDALVRSMPSPPHLTCFSYHSEDHHHENGILTMWRLYGGTGRGVALGFDTEKLRLITEQIQKERAVDTIFLDSVAYGAEDAQTKQRMDDFKGLPSLYLRALAAILSNDREGFSSDHEDLFKFLVLAVTSKHPDFEDEREVRLVSFEAIDATLRDRAPLRKVGPRRLIECASALNEVVIGPSDLQRDYAKRVEVWLTLAGREEVSIRVSATPYRQIK